MARGLGERYGLAMPIDKHETRARIRTLRDAIAEADRASRIGLAVERLTAGSAWRSARTVALYLSMPGEPDLRPLAARADAEGRAVVVPVVARRGAPLVWRVWRPGQPLRASRFGVPEPLPDAPEMPPAAVDLAVVPALAVDRTGTRLGYGGGYYDRSLPAMTGAALIWIGLAEQILPEIPREAHDVPVHALVTADGWTETEAARPALPGARLGQPG